MDGVRFPPPDADPGVAFSEVLPFLRISALSVLESWYDGVLVSISAGFARLLYALGGVSADRALMAAKPELGGALIEAKPDVVGGGLVSYVDDGCLATLMIGGVRSCVEAA